MGCFASKEDLMDGGYDDFEKAQGQDQFGLKETHKVLELLGTGGTGETWLCRCISSGQLQAVKMIRRPIPKVILPMVLEEIKIQGDLGEGHLNIVNAHEVYLTETHLALCMEYAAGGSLTNYVADRWESTQERGGLFLCEDEARFLFKQFLSAVEYCHKHHVAHRDLKLDNTLLDDSEPPLIKLCDFGFAKNWGDAEHNCYTQIGTPVYMCPQLINNNDGKRGYDGTKADVWATGVLLFVMLLGMFPFEHDNHPNPTQSVAQLEVWLQQIKSSWRENPRIGKYAKKLSAECRDLLDRIFELDESKRITIPEIKQHPWFTKPLSPKFQLAWMDVQQKQHKLDKLAEIGAFQNSKRDEALKQMMHQAAFQPSSVVPHQTFYVDLKKPDTSNHPDHFKENTETDEDTES